ncbi:MAG: PKD domain-containing protein [Bacteroidota bacterium]
MEKIFSHRVLFLLFLLGMATEFTSCTDDNTEPYYKTPIASFQYAIDAGDPMKVNFKSYSQNYDNLQWNFGDGSVSSEANVTHTFPKSGKFTVVLTAQKNGEAHEFKKTMNIIDPDDAAFFLHGGSEKKWQFLWVNGTNTLGIYDPAANDKSPWWSFGINTKVEDRPCIVDDEYIFTFDGKFINDTNETFYLDSEANGGHKAGSGLEGCQEETASGIFTNLNGVDVSAWDHTPDDNYTYTYNATESKLTIDGLGAYIGLVKFSNAGDTRVPVQSITYVVDKLVDTETVDTLKIIVKYNGADWRMLLVHYDDLSLRPQFPTKSTTPAKQKKTKDLYDDFTGAAGSSTVTWKTNEVSLFELGASNPSGPPSSKVGRYKKGTGSTENIQFELDYIVDFSQRNKFKMYVYIPSTNDFATVDPAPEPWSGVNTLQRTVTLRFYDSKHGAPWETQAQVVKTLTAGDMDKWVELEFDFSAWGTSSVYDKIILQLGGEGHHRPGEFFVSGLELL